MKCSLRSSSIFLGTTIKARVPEGSVYLTIIESVLSRDVTLRYRRMYFKLRDLRDGRVLLGRYAKASVVVDSWWFFEE